MFSSVFASAMLLHAASLGQNAAAWASEAAQIQTTQGQPGLGVAQNKVDRLSMPHEKDGAVSSTNKGDRLPMPSEKDGAVSSTKAVEAAESVDAASQEEAADKFGGALLAGDKATDQTDDLLYPTEEELRAMQDRIKDTKKAAQPAEKAAEPEESAGKTDTAKAKRGGADPNLSKEAEADVSGEFSVLSAAAKASKGTDDPIPVVDEETLSLYPTAAQCGECHKQIYEEWSSSQHAYASISPMFHKFEQKFTELTQGTVGTFCVR
jgi:hypothetical protein